MSRQSQPARVALPTRQRRPGYVALALTLIVGLAGVGAWLYSEAGQTTPVVVMVGEVPAGHRVDRDDVSTVDVAGSVTAIGGDRLSEVVGMTAAVHLLPNMLVQRSMVTGEQPLSSGEAAVGVAVRGGQLPAEGVAAGELVAVLRIPVTGSAAATAEVEDAQTLVRQARVYDTRPDPAQAGGTLVTLIVPSTSVEAVAAASGSGQAALARVGVS